MSLPEYVAVTWEATICANCSMNFAVPVDWISERRRTGNAFFCPNGHSLSFKETSEKILKKRLEAKEAELTRERERTKRAQRQVSAGRGQITRIKNRVSNGVCPCCNRTFQNLLRHMGTQHPDWKVQEVGL